MSDKRRPRPQVVGEHFRLERKLGEGAFGAVYSAVDTRTNEKVAVKLEPLGTKDPQLIFEGKLLKLLGRGGATGIPAVHWFGSAGDYSCLVMDLMGPNLEELFDSCGRKFSLKTVLMMTDQMISRLEHIHNMGFLHRDIKPENFLMGGGRSGTKAGTVHAIDFGLSKQFKDPRTGEHIPAKTGKSLIGTARYASINCHEGLEQGRRDDLEAVGHMVIYFLRGGKLPWQGIDAKDWDDRCRKITSLKKRTPTEVLCKDLPVEFAEYLNYCRNLSFKERPDYNMLRNKIKDLMKSEGMDYDLVYDWTPPQPACPQSERRQSLQSEADEAGRAIAVGAV